MSTPFPASSDCETLLARAVDIDEIARIEQAAYEFPWTPGNLRDSLEVGHGFPCLRSAGVIFAYGIVMPVVDEAHLLNLTVAPAWQGRGWGGEILRCCMQLAASRFGARSILLEVRPSNAPALALYAAHGFRQIGRRRAYYPARDGREDALVLRRGLP